MSNDIVTRVEEQGIEFYTVNATGESGLSQSGLGRLCDVPESTLRDLFTALRGNKGPESLKPILGKEFHLAEKYRYKNYEVKIVRAEICAALIMHYAFKGNQVAQYSLQKFTAVGINTWIQGITGYKPQLQAERHPTTVYADRLLNHSDHIIPFGYWSVFHESAWVLLHIEKVLMIKVEAYDTADISMGLLWAAFRKDNEWALPFTKYNHYYRDTRKSQPANAYDISELPYFKQWLTDIYQPVHLPVYLERKRKQQLKDQKKLNP